MDTCSIIDKRALIFAARMRFSPQSQFIRDIALEKIIERQLVILDREGGVTLQEIMEQEDICLVDGTQVITRVDIEKSLERLSDTKAVIPSDISGEIRYKLSKKALQEYSQSQRAIEELFTRVVNRLFKNTEENATVYHTPFLECLCIIFSQLGEFYVRIIKGDVDLDELLRLPIIKHAFQSIGKKYQDIDKSCFESAVYSFFEDTDPDFDTIKWNMAQNYYIAKAIGLDPSGHLLSREVFGNAVFYLDTNVLIQALEPKARHHKSFKVLSKSCNNLEIHLNVCQISLNELSSLLEFQRELIEKVADQIPNETAPKIRGIFYQLYRERLESEGTVDFNVLFDSFYRAKEELAQVYDIELIDDRWFDVAINEKETEELIYEIKRLYRAKHNRPKNQFSALHDALLLRWLQLERKQSAQNTWLVTLDTSLPSYLPKQEKSPGRQLALTLDALLQWISPVGIYEEGDENEVAAIFSEAVKYQILPQEKLFDLRDFLIFAEMEWETKELPAQDVEDCIRYIKHSAPDLDPSEASDREKIAREISKFFADPGRKYKQDLEKLEAKVIAITDERSRETKEFEKKIINRDEEIKKLESNITNIQESFKKDKIRRSALLRLVIAVILFFSIEGGITWLTSKFGEGPNLFQKLIKSWPLTGFGGIIGLLLIWFMLGRERIKALGWAFTKLFKTE